jgi:hypothetical protein
MLWTAWIGMALGVVLAATPKLGPPPVILELGPIVPTPAPTPKHAVRKRLITVITVQNSPNGDSVVSFEASDVSDEGKERVHTLASKTYSLADENPELNDLKQRILKEIRDLEREMLKFAEKAGPPKEREPLVPGRAP